MTNAGPTLPGPPIEEDALSAYLDDELDADARAAVEIRLAASPEWRAVLAELRETRDALRALPQVDGAPEFWARALAPSGDDDQGAQDDQGDQGDQDEAVVHLETQRRARRHNGWRVAVAGVAAAIVVIAVGVAVVPERTRVKPAVATFTDAHATRASVGEDPLSNLASVGVPGFNR